MTSIKTSHDSSALKEATRLSEPGARGDMPPPQIWADQFTLGGVQNMPTTLLLVPLPHLIFRTSYCPADNTMLPVYWQQTNVGSNCKVLSLMNKFSGRNSQLLTHLSLLVLTISKTARPNIFNFKFLSDWPGSFNYIDLHQVQY